MRKQAFLLGRQCGKPLATMSAAFGVPYGAANPAQSSVRRMRKLVGREAERAIRNGTAYIAGKRYTVPFARIITPRFTKDIDELRTFRTDIRQILTKHAIKDAMRGLGRPHIMNDMSVKIKRKILLVKLQANLKLYDKVYAEAVAGYEQAVVNWLRAQLCDMGKPIDRRPKQMNLHCPHGMPQNYRDEYVQAIEMLKLASDSTIALTGEQFASLCLNKWGWMENFKMSAGVYTNCAASL